MRFLAIAASNDYYSNYIYHCINIMSLKCLSQIETHAQEVLLDSGRSIFHIGNYHSCLSTQGMDYFFVNLADKQTLSPFGGIGLCLSSSCAPEQVQGLVGYVLDKLQLPITISSIDTNIPQIKYDFNFMFFFTVILLCSLAALALMSTLSKTVRKHRMLSAFALQNSIKIFEYKNNPLNTLNGVRALCMLWVIMGHQYGSTMNSSENGLTLQQQITGPFFLIIEGGLLAVDTFFFVGGFLVAYAVLREKSLNPFKYPLAIFNRFLRFIPAYLVALLIYYTFFPHAGSGPLWKSTIVGYQYCSHMWRALVFVDNLIDNGVEQCMPWGWYLQNDMQIFIYSILALFVYGYSRFWGYMFIIWSILVSCLVSMVGVYLNGFHYLLTLKDFFAFGDYLTFYYIKPWIRCPPYLYGLLLGIMYANFLQAESEFNSQNMLVKLKQKLIKSRGWKYAVQLLGIGISSFIILIPKSGQGDNSWPLLVHSAFLTYSKLVFVVGLSLVLLPSLLGVESMVRFAMDTKLFNFVAKVSFCTYLVHLTLILIFLGSRSVDFYYDTLSIYNLFAAHAVQSIFCGFLLTMLVEVPFAKLQKILMRELLKSPKEQRAKPEAQLKTNETVVQVHER